MRMLVVSAAAAALVLSVGSSHAGDVDLRLGAGDGFVVRDSSAKERFRVDEVGRIYSNETRLSTMPTILDSDSPPKPLGRTISISGMSQNLLNF